MLFSKNSFNLNERIKQLFIELEFLQELRLKANLFIVFVELYAVLFNHVISRIIQK